MCERKSRLGEKNEGKAGITGWDGKNNRSLTCSYDAHGSKSGKERSLCAKRRGRGGSRVRGGRIKNCIDSSARQVRRRGGAKSLRKVSMSCVGKGKKLKGTEEIEGGNESEILKGEV